MYGDMFKGIGTLFVILAIGAVFGAWKIVELLVWLFSHIHWGTP
jgi:hypothetical protein